MIICNKCGTMCSDDHLFCQKCGNKITNSLFDNVLKDESTNQEAVLSFEKLKSYDNNINFDNEVTFETFQSNQNYNNVVSYNENLGKPQEMKYGNNPFEKVIVPPRAATIQQQVFTGSVGVNKSNVPKINIDYQIFCPVCGFLLGDNPEHCPNCGKRFNNNDKPLIKQVDELNNVKAVLEYKYENITENELDLDNDGIADNEQRNQLTNRMRQMKNKQKEEELNRKKTF